MVIIFTKIPEGTKKKDALSIPKNKDIKLIYAIQNFSISFLLYLTL